MTAAMSAQAAPAAGRAWGNRDHEDSTRIIHAALQMPGSTSSTPPTCIPAGESEEIVGEGAPLGRRDEVVLATKVHGTMGPGQNPGRQLSTLDPS